MGPGGYRPGDRNDKGVALTVKEPQVYRSRECLKKQRFGGESLRNLKCRRWVVQGTGTDRGRRNDVTQNKIVRNTRRTHTVV